MAPDAETLLLTRCAEALGKDSLDGRDQGMLDDWWAAQRRIASPLLARLMELQTSDWTEAILGHPAHADNPWYALLADAVDLDEFATFMLENDKFPAFLHLAEQALAAQITDEGRAALHRNIAEEQEPVPHHHLMRRLMVDLRDKASPNLALSSYPELVDRTLSFHYGYFRDPWSLVGALYVTEVVALERLKSMDAGLRRLGFGDHTCEFLTIHMTCDEHHAREWSECVIVPTLERAPELRETIAAGIAVTLENSARYLAALVKRFHAQRVLVTA